jgi:hypothetical protein
MAGPFFPVRRGAENFGVADLSEPGAYYIQLGDRNDAQRSVKPYTLETIFTATEDKFEPNQSFGKARPIPASGTLKAAILPRGDRDWYRVEVDKPGTLSVVLSLVPKELTLWMEVYDFDARRIAGPFFAPHEGADNSAKVSLPAGGAYFIQIGERNDARSSAASYTLTTEFAPAP